METKREPLYTRHELAGAELHRARPAVHRPPGPRQNNAPELRIAGSDALAESAKRIGDQFTPDLVSQVVAGAEDTLHLTMRTDASQSLGAHNLRTGETSEIIRSHHAG